MAYPNRLGEFTISDSDDWVKKIRFNERPPIATRGLMNPWEAERLRAVWLQEKAVWPEIQSLQREYTQIERAMASDVNTFNAHLIELERVTKKKTGIGPIGTYGGMGLAVIPGFGWFAAALSAVTMVIEMIGGNKKKKRINQLMQIMEQARVRLEKAKERLIEIQYRAKELTGTTERAQAMVAAKRQTDEAATQASQRLHDATRLQQEQVRSLERAQIRQQMKNRVYSKEDEL